MLKIKEYLNDKDEKVYITEMARIKNEAALLGFRTLAKMLTDENTDLSAINDCIDQSLEEYRTMGGALC